MQATVTDGRAQNTFEQVFGHLREFSHIALKGHLLVEESLDRIIARHCRAASVLDEVDMSFYVKAKLATALVGDSHYGVLWDLVWKLHLIRVEIAQKVESPRASQLIREFVEAKSRWASEPRQAVTNDDQLRSRFADSIAHVLGVLADVEANLRDEAARGRRAGK